LTFYKSSSILSTVYNTAAALPWVGHNVLLYDGSFQDWQQRDLPVENPTAKKDK
jgi:3-mercaptopyruvate sulfurtransferase SseA